MGTALIRSYNFNMILLIITILIPYTSSLIDYPVCDSNFETRFNNDSSNEIIALILARGGSKGIPLKNLRKLNDKSLLGRSLEIINHSNIFEEIWVSTDDESIAIEAEKFSARVHMRPSEFAADHTTSIEAVLQFLHYHSDIQNLALIQCTSVFLRKKYLQEAAKFLRSSDCVFSAVRSFKLRWDRNPHTGYMTPLNFDPANRPRRQNWSGELMETGMFYFAKRFLLDQGLFQNSRCKVVEIDANDSLEIDTFNDLKLAAKLLND